MYNNQLFNFAEKKYNLMTGRNMFTYFIFVCLFLFSLCLVWFSGFFLFFFSHIFFKEITSASLASIFYICRSGFYIKNKNNTKNKTQQQKKLVFPSGFRLFIVVNVHVYFNCKCYLNKCCLSKYTVWYSILVDLNRSNAIQSHRWYCSNGLFHHYITVVMLSPRTTL